MSNLAVVTGAGSGVGRDVALKLAGTGWDVALIGRRPAPLEETIRLAGKVGSRLVAVACDVSRETDVATMAQRVLDELGTPTALVNSAGINVRNRSIRELSVADYQRVIEINLNGSFYCMHAFLPGMRQQRRGTIVNIVSDAGMFPVAVAGPAYVASKYGLSGLTQAINSEERANGIRCCCIYPGAINTPILDNRPTPPTPEARQKMLQVEDVTECVMLAINLPQRAVIDQLLIRPL